MAHQFSGKWQIDHALSSSQKPLLEAMGRAKWQIYVIDGADEDFELIYEEKVKNEKKVHTFTKNVRVFLNSSVLTIMSKVFPIPFNEIKYNHTFVHGTKVHYKDDIKGFGECDSVTTYNAEHNTFTIRWYLNCGLLTAFHSLEKPNQFRIDMKLECRDRPDIVVYKVYRRVS